jgi:CheY-like chemotaxis protein
MERRHLPNPPARPLVLLVYGHQNSVALYAIAVSGMGFEVMAATDATEAFGRAWKNRPDIIVTELVIEGAGGWELLAQLKREPRTRDIPVVVLTGDAQLSTHARTRREGCAALFVKPCLPDQLAMKLREVLSPAFSHARIR